MAKEAQAVDQPQSISNLQLSNEELNMSPASNNQTISAKSRIEGGVDAQEISKLESLSKEASNIESSFTEYIVPEHEKTMVQSIFEQPKTNSTSLVQRNNSNHGISKAQIK